MDDIAALIQDLDSPNADKVENAKLALLAQGSAAVDALLDKLTQADAKAAWKIISLLAQIRDPRSVMTVSQYLFAEHNVLRIAAAQCLGKIGQPQATEPLLVALHNSKYSSELTWIVQALGAIADPRAVDALIVVLHETDSESVRYTAIEALGLIGDRRSIPSIKEYQDDPSRHVRNRAKLALERLQAGQSAPFPQRPAEASSLPTDYHVQRI